MTTVMRSALHSLSDQDGKLVCDDGSDFDFGSYSRFKYGKASIARKYGHQLVEHFIKQHPDIAMSTQRILVTGPSYKYLGTAAQGICSIFSMMLNAYRVSHGIEPIIALHVIRSWVGTDTYAMSSAEERRKSLKSGEHHVNGELVNNSIIIVIDDVRVTGATEERMHARLISYEPATICYLHIAKIDESYGLANADLENIMNKTFITTLDTIESDIESDDFRFNSRVFRTIMETRDSDALYRFFTRRSDVFIETAYDYLVGGTFEMYGRHPRNTQALERVICERKFAVARFI